MLSRAPSWWLYGRIYDWLWDNALTEVLADRILAALGDRFPALDVGAGTGLITRRLRSAGPVIACEPDPGMAERLRRRLPDVETMEVPLEILLGPGWPAKPRYEGVQSAVAANVLGFVEDPPAAIIGLRALVGEGGIVVVVVPVNGTSVYDILVAQRRAGVSVLDAARFLGLQLVVVPFVRLFGGPRWRPVDLPETGMIARYAASSAFELVLYSGIDAEAPAQSR